MTKIINLLTNANIKDLFENNFDLANFAIKLAQERMESEGSVTLTEILKELERMAEEKRKEEGDE